MKKLIAIISLSLLCATTSTLAGKVYKWTDSEGNIHYGERPPSTQAKEVDIHKAPPSSRNALPAGNSLQETNKLLVTLQKERQQKAEKKATAEKERKAREANCSRSKRRLAGYRIGGRIYEIDEQGERSYLSDSDIQQRLEATQKEVGKWCK
ncbi:MAG: DUF4124 domain-containing protein [Gammaproteobacteria bacterium]|nr:DUF4124 domain-containing protein [Gammaproteobacteria bacterium]MCF6361931.1 DUF4124 domain-containing protein [Gammaproteobacteria bacterium]